MSGLSEDSPLMRGYVRIFKTFLSAIHNFENCERFAEKLSRWDVSKIAHSWSKAATPMKCGFAVVNFQKSFDDLTSLS